MCHLRNVLKDFTRERLRLNRVEFQLDFLKKCRDSNLCPAFLRINRRFPDHRLRRIVNTCEAKLLRTELRNVRRNLSNQGTVVYRLYCSIEKLLCPLEIDNFMHRINTLLQRDSDIISSNQAKKFHSLSTRLSNLHFRPAENVDYVANSNVSNYLNLSSYTPTRLEQTLLNTSPKYAFSNVIQPIERVLPCFEQAVTNLPPNIRFDVRKLMHNALTNNRCNKKISHQKEQLKTISKLKNNSAINILSADKNQQLVILDKTDFLTKATECIAKLNPKTIKKDPTNTIVSKLATLKKNLELPLSIRNACYPPMYCSIPKIFFVIKIHKTGHPFRPLVARYNAPTYNVEKALSKYLQPFFDLHPYSINSSYQLKNNINNLMLPEQVGSIALDVINLFPSVPINTATDLVLEKLQQHNVPPNTIAAISSAINLIVNNVFFTFNNIIYKQTEGAPMGLSISPILAEATLQYMELQTFTIFKPPILFQRYVDDVLIVFDKKEDNIKDIFNHLNQFFPSIKFTMESSTNNCISFLDLNIHFNNNRIELSIFRKPTNTTNIIPYNSHHANNHKWAFFKSAIHRAVNLPTTNKFVLEELSYIRKIAKSNGYPIRTVNKIICQNINAKDICSTSSSNHSPSTKPIEKYKYISLPYFQDLHRPLCKILKNLPLRIAYSASPTVFSLLKSDRDKTVLVGGIYKIPFLQSSKVYIGRTKRSLNLRIKEHQYALKSGSQSTSLTEFVRQQNLYPDFNNASIIMSPRNQFTLNFSEALQIYVNRNSAINTHSALFIDSAWRDLADKFIAVAPHPRLCPEDEEDHPV